MKAKVTVEMSPDMYDALEDMLTHKYLVMVDDDETRREMWDKYKVRSYDVEAFLASESE